MTERANLQKLMTWLSPAFPVGSFAYSAGLESAIADGRVTTCNQLDNWLEGSLSHGAASVDCLLIALSHNARNNAAILSEIADLLIALTPARERVAEVLTTGDAFIAASAAWPDPVLSRLPAPCPYPVALGAIVGAHNIGLDDLLSAWLTAYLQAQISVAVRLIPIGQTDGLRILAGFAKRIDRCAEHAAQGTLDDIGAISYASDIATMSHETLGTRIFRS